MKPWTRIEPTTHYKIGYLDVVGKTFELGDGHSHHFECYAPEDSHEVAVVALTVDAFVIVARQFRPGPEVIMDQLPGGGVEPKDRRGVKTDEAAAKVAAKREFKEETGYVPGDIQPIGVAHRSGYGNSTSHYFLATDCIPSGEAPALDEHEQIEVDLITIEQLFRNAREGRMTDIAGVFFAYDYLSQVLAGQRPQETTGPDA